MLQLGQDKPDDRNDNPTMTDQQDPGGSVTNGLGSMKINFGGAADAAPVAPAGGSGLGGFGGISIISDAPADAAPLAGGPVTAPAGEGRTSSKVLIIGSGPAGLTAAIYAARANLEPIVLAGSAPGGQLMLTSEIENYPGFPEGIDGPDLMGRFRAQAERFGTHVVDVDIDRVDLSSRPFRAWARGTEYSGESLIVATGASALWLNLESETAAARPRRLRLRHLRRVLLPGPRDRGGGRRRLRDGGGQLPHPVRDEGPPAPPPRRASARRKIMIDRAYGNPKIDVHVNTAIDEVVGDAKVEGLRLRDTQTGATSEMPIEGLFIAIGHKPNTDVFRDWLDVDEKGYLVVHDETEPRSPACSSPATSRTTATARPSRPPATAARQPSTPSAGWRARASRSTRPPPRGSRRRRGVSMRGGGVRSLARTGGSAPGPGRLTPPSGDFERVPAGAARRRRSGGSPRSSGPTAARSRSCWSRSWRRASSA